MERGEGFLDDSAMLVEEEVSVLRDDAGSRVNFSETVEVKMYGLDNSNEEGTSISAVRVYCAPGMKSPFFIRQLKSMRVEPERDSRPEVEGKNVLLVVVYGVRAQGMSATLGPLRVRMIPFSPPSQATPLNPVSSMSDLADSLTNTHQHDHTPFETRTTLPSQQTRHKSKPRYWIWIRGNWGIRGKRNRRRGCRRR